MAKWRMRVCVGYNSDGTPVVKQVSANSELALADAVIKAGVQSERRREFLPEQPEQYSTPSPAPKVELFKDYAQRWFTTYKVPSLKDNSLEMYAASIDKLNTALGDIPLDDITTDLLQRTINAFAQAPRRNGKQVAKSTIEKYRLTVRQIMRSAYEDGLIAKDPAATKRLKNPSSVVNKRTALSDPDYFEILSRIPKLRLEDQLLMGLLAYTGMRKGEILGLRWDNVDFTARLIRVRDNAVYPNGDNEPKLTTPKTKTSVRDIGIWSR